MTALQFNQYMSQSSRSHYGVPNLRLWSREDLVHHFDIISESIRLTAMFPTINVLSESRLATRDIYLSAAAAPELDAR